MERTPTTQTASWFLDLRKMQKLNLAPPYQRYSVWNVSFKRFFIDTVLRNYPCPAIFLVKDYNADLEPTYGVVDGKQRLTSIFDFVDGRFTTSHNDGEPAISEKYFSDLGDDLKRAVLDYSMTVEVLNKASGEELREAFDRMNRNVQKLNAQELRHAKYSGKFITVAETLAADPFWENTSVATQRRLDRMGDIEFISELVVLTERGVQHGKDILDDVYAEYDDGLEDETILLGNYDRILEVVKGLGVSGTAKAPFGKVVDIYGLWAAIRSVLLVDKKGIDIAASVTRLLAFADELEADETQEAHDYHESTQKQTNSAASRNRRASLLKGRLVSVATA